eukprot:9468547-Pyramimonas_sp.AAC.1
MLVRGCARHPRGATTPAHRSQLIQASALRQCVGAMTAGGRPASAPRYLGSSGSVLSSPKSARRAELRSKARALLSAPQFRSKISDGVALARARAAAESQRSRSTTREHGAVLRENLL